MSFPKCGRPIPSPAAPAKKNGSPIPMVARAFVKYCYRPLPRGLFRSIIHSTRRELHHHHFLTMTFLVPSGNLLIRVSEDQLISLVARFINDATLGAILTLPANAVLHKRNDGLICLGRNGSLPTPLWEPLSHDIVATIVRWSKADLQEAA